MIRRVARAAVGAALALCIVPSAADASHHNARITEIFAGASGAGTVQFVEVTMWTTSQHLLTGRKFYVFDKDGNITLDYTFPNNVLSGAQRSWIIGSASMGAFFGVTPNFPVNLGLNRTGGKVCFQTGTITVVDCVAWGNSNSTANTGNPFGPLTGIPLGQSLVRDITGGTSATTLDSLDDTNDSAADFDATPNSSPKNNANVTTTTAGSMGVSGDELTYTAAATNIVNKPTLLRRAGTGTIHELTDIVAPVTAGAGCTRLGVNVVRCLADDPDPGGYNHITLNTGGGNDIVEIRGTPVHPNTVNGGAGKDNITAAPNGSTLNGGTGDDTLKGGLGADVLTGDLDNDKLDGGGGPDSLAGGPGSDTASYSTRTGAVVATIDGNPNDGDASDDVGGVRDNILLDVENLTGGSGDDSLTGSAKDLEAGISGANLLDGGFGADDLFGLTGTDTANYSSRTAGVFVNLSNALDDEGNADDGAPLNGDHFDGLERVYGGSGADHLTGNDVGQTLRGGGGMDTLVGLGGNDVLELNDNLADHYDCGTGTDSAAIDEGVDIDDGAGACETET